MLVARNDLGLVPLHQNPSRQHSGHLQRTTENREVDIRVTWVPACSVLQWHVPRSLVTLVSLHLVRQIDPKLNSESAGCRPSTVIWNSFHHLEYSCSLHLLYPGPFRSCCIVGERKVGSVLCWFLSCILMFLTNV